MPFPLPYRIILTVLEPLFAFAGAALVFRDPGAYLGTMTQERLTSVDSSTRFIYTQLGGGWLYFAFVEAVVLRLYPDDRRLWRLLCIGMLLSDAAYAHGCAQAFGGWAAWADVAQWTRDDWTVFWTTAPMLLARLCFVLGVGLSSENRAAKKLN